ncbi:MAG TPA: MSMEG_3727 family PQQ-associated protein [Thermoanaerobaculia bacterium]|nr:MSMEG_3727 family PQQ-associated protein [Thermoanaerobaculia bacterium]
MRAKAVVVALAAAGAFTSCEYVRLLRPSVLKQLNPRVVRLVNELPELDAPNKEIIARLFAHGGLSHARIENDGMMHDTIRVPRDQLIWEPAIIVMPHAGVLQLEFSNEDQAHHMAFLPNDGERMVLDLPMHTRGEAKVHLSQPGYYFFGCPVANHAGRGMLGLIIVPGEVPDTAKLDRPPQRRP